MLPDWMHRAEGWATERPAVAATVGVLLIAAGMVVISVWVDSLDGSDVTEIASTVLLLWPIFFAVMRTQTLDEDERQGGPFRTWLLTWRRNPVTALIVVAVAVVGLVWGIWSWR